MSDYSSCNLKEDNSLLLRVKTCHTVFIMANSQCSIISAVFIN